MLYLDDKVCMRWLSGVTCKFYVVNVTLALLADIQENSMSRQTASHNQPQPSLYSLQGSVNHASLYHQWDLKLRLMFMDHVHAWNHVTITYLEHDTLQSDVLHSIWMHISFEEIVVRKSARFFTLGNMAQGIDTVIEMRNLLQLQALSHYVYNNLCACIEWKTCAAPEECWRIGWSRSWRHWTGQSQLGENAGCVLIQDNLDHCLMILFFSIVPKPIELMLWVVQSWIEGLGNGTLMFLVHLFLGHLLIVSTLPPKFLWCKQCSVFECVDIASAP